MARRMVLITGATSGIGKATAVGLAAMKAHLALTGRDTERTQAASDEIRTASVEVDAVVWATGYRSDYSWLHVPGVIDDGHVRHEAGVTEVSGLYFLGPHGRRRRPHHRRRRCVAGTRAVLKAVEAGCLLRARCSLLVARLRTHALNMSAFTAAQIEACDGCAAVDVAGDGPRRRPPTLASEPRKLPPRSPQAHVNQLLAPFSA
jgi:hypothetical protein